MPPAVFGPEKVIRIDAFSRSEIRASRADSEAEALSKGMWLGEKLSACSNAERRTALENWCATGKLKEADVTAAYAYYGWERAP